MDNKMLDDEDNFVEQPPSSDLDSKKSNETLTAEKTENTSLNSSQSSFVQLKSANEEKSTSTKEITTKATSPKLTTSLASKWFGRKTSVGKADRNEKASTNEKKKTLQTSKSAPQITQVIYKRKSSLPDIPVENTSNNKKGIVSIPDEEQTDEDNIYAEINETQLVLEEMRRSLNQHTSERKIIEMILQQPSNLQDTK